MEPEEMERRFKAMYHELGLTPEQAQSSWASSCVATEKAAAAQGMAFKSSERRAGGDHHQRRGVHGQGRTPAPADGCCSNRGRDTGDDDPMAEIDDLVDEPAEAAGDYIGDMRGTSSKPCWPSCSRRCSRCRRWSRASATCARRA
jgi:hypothetical protein